MSQSAVHPAAEVAVVSWPEGDVVNAGRALRALGQKGGGPKTLSTVPACGPDDSCLSSPVCWHNSPCPRAVPQPGHGDPPPGGLTPRSEAVVLVTPGSRGEGHDVRLR